MVQPVLTGSSAWTVFRRLREPVRAQTGALILAMAVFLSLGWLAVDHVTDSIDEMISHTAEAGIRSDIARNVLDAVVNAEREQRGYLLTAKPKFLLAAITDMDRLDDLLVTLKSRLAKDAESRAAFEDLSASARRKVAVMRTALEKAGPEYKGPSGAVVMDEAGEVAMEQAQAAAIAILTASEQERHRLASKLQLAQSNVTDILVSALVAAVMLLGATALVLVWSKARLSRARDGERRDAELFRAAIEHVSHGVAVFDAAGLLRLANSRFAPTLAVPEPLTTPGQDLLPIAGAAAFDPPLSPARPNRPSSSEVRQGPRTLEVWRSPMPDGGQMLSVSDVTRRVEAEEVGRQAQKMDVLGQMTGGVAHDFNNLLQIVSANLELVRSKVQRLLPDDAALLARIDAATAGVARGARLTRHLLAFARRQPLAPEPIEPARLLSGLEDVLRRTLGESIGLDIMCGTGLWSMRADPTQVENALLNLTLNARDAMAGEHGLGTGQLMIEAANAALDHDDVARVPDVTPGQYVMFAVSDTGSGMTPEQIARATEPFYTTKAEGRGTGLGLSMVLGFAKQSGGHFQLFSQPGRGTTARLYIPRTSAIAQDPVPVSAELPPGHGESVLLVEDDPAVRQVAFAAVTGLGYQVTEAENADAALVLLQAGLRPRVLFTDVVMPGTLSAKALADQARALVPGLVVLFTSGYTNDNITSHGQLDADVTLLSKPWRTDELARALQHVLSGASRPASLRRVLLVEDEELVRLTTADALAEMGFDVLQAGSAAAALARLSPVPDLLMTDLGLPDGDGTALVAEIRRRLPALPVIVASGHSEPADHEVVWLAKPFDRQGLRRAVDAALGA